VYAISATNATNTTQFNGQAASFYQNAANLTAGSLPDARLDGTYTGPLTFSNAANSITGNGTGLINVNALQLGGRGLGAFGRLAIAQSWTAANAFGNAGNSFSGTFTGIGTGLTSVNADLLDGIKSTAFGRLAVAQSWTAANTFSSGSNSFTGNGAGLTNVNADTLDGLDSTAFLQAVPNPLILSGSTAGGLIQVDSSNTAANATGISVVMSGLVGSNAAAVLGIITNAASNFGQGVYGLHSGGGNGVIGYSERGFGVAGFGGPTATGVYAQGGVRAFQADGPSLLNGVVELSTGNFLSIGAGASPGFPLHFASSLGNKISLFGTNSTSHYGLGVQGGILQIYTDLLASAIAFGSGSSTSFTERARFSGNANLIFRNDNADLIATVQTPYDLDLQLDRDNDNTDAWFRVWTNSRAIEHMRINDDDEAAAVFDGAVIANGIDYAEAFKAADPSLEPGDLVVSSGNWEFIIRTQHAYDSAVIGVISTRPAFVAGMSFDAEDRIDPELTKRRDQARADGDMVLEKQLPMQMSELVKQAYRPVAFMGRVPVKVTGAIKVGDHLAAAAIPGHAAAMDRAGQSIGIALEASDGGERKIMVLVQPKYFVPEAQIPQDLGGQLEQITAQFNRVLTENQDLRTRLERPEAALAHP